jgi:hypothetical protein
VSDLAAGSVRYACNVMSPLDLDYLNQESKHFRLGWRNDFARLGRYESGMAKPRHDWYFNQWLVHFGKTQADLVNDLDWNKSKASLFGSGQQRYHRDDINQLANYLGLEPFELLLPPHRAMALRQYRASAETIVTLAHENTGTDG